MSHWESLQEEEVYYDSYMEQVPEDEIQQDNVPASSPGSYHSKSALRDHESNIRLYIYRRDYNKLHKMVGSDPYTEEYLQVLPQLWRCFFLKSQSLNLRFDVSETNIHTKPSPALSSYLNHVRKCYRENEVMETLMVAECKHLFGIEITKEDISASLFYDLDNELSSLHDLMVWINLCVLIMNMKFNKSRPDVYVDLPGIVDSIGEEVYVVTYNKYISVTVCGQALRVHLPHYDQILQKDLFLTLSDKLNERFNIMLTCKIMCRISERGLFPGDEGDKRMYCHVRDIIDYGDNLVSNHGNRAFDLLGKFEAYCVSSILLGDNPMIWDNEEFQRNLLEDDRKEQPDLYPSAVKLCELLNQLSAQELAEIHGLWRVWGHPIIDLEGGLRKMEATSLKQPNVSKLETKIGERTFKLLYFRNYRNKHGHYPLSTLSSSDDIELYSPYMKDRDKIEYQANQQFYNDNDYVHKSVRNNRQIDENNAMYRHKSWDLVGILQSFQIPASMNLATMIKDKAISMTREELIEAAGRRNTVFDQTKRRGVLKWLSEQTYKIKDFLMSVDNDGIPENDLIIGLYPKEREMKTKARFFSLMSYVLRMYVTITEELLGNYILKYFPMITMSDSLLDMIIRLYNMTTLVGVGNNSVTYSMNIDFSKWNQNMRERTNEGIFSKLDRILGLRHVISRTHGLFRKSYIYLCSGEYVPTILNGNLTAVSPYSRIGDESGKEGLRQKGWTITTVCDIVSLAFSHRAKIELIGGGDNQVLTVTWRIPDTSKQSSPEQNLLKVRARMDRFRTALAKKMEKRGLPLKLEETWISHRLLMYNKIMYLDGVPLKGRLKIASRIFSNSNDGIMTLGNITSTLSTGFQALSAKDYTPCLAWALSRVFTCINLAQYYMANPMSGTRRLDKQIHLSYQNKNKGISYFGIRDITDDEQKKKKTNIDFSREPVLSALELIIIGLYYHKILGGPGIGTPYSYIMKGFPDPLSESLTFSLNTLKNLHDPSIIKMISCISCVKASDVMHWEHLLEDPVSINHDAPAHGIAALRSSAERIMKEADIQNVQFKELTEIGENTYLKDLSEALCYPAQLEPRLLHDIVGATIPGYVNTILSKVDQSATLSKLASGEDIVAKIYESEIEYLMYLSRKIKYVIGIPLGECPTEHAQNLRNNTWNRDIIGVTTPHPAAYIRLSDHTRSNESCDQNFIMVTLKKTTRQVLERGPFRPYFGSYTQEKFKQGQMAAAYGDEDLLKRSIKIQKLLRWRYQEGSSMYSLIQGILTCVTNSNPDKFLPSTEEISGDVEHRYHDMATKHGGIPTNLILPYTRVSCNTSTFIEHSKGAGNESLHFQALIIYCGMMGYIRSAKRDMYTDVYHFHEICNQCIQPIRHVADDNSDLQASVSLMSCPDNDLMYIKEEDIPVHFHHVKRMECEDSKRTKNYRIVNLEGDYDQRMYSCALLAIITVMDKGSKMTESGFSMLLDLFDAEQLMCILQIWFYHYLVVLKKIPFMKGKVLQLLEWYHDNQARVDLVLERASMIRYCRQAGYIMSSSSFSQGVPCTPEVLHELLQERRAMLRTDMVCIRLADPDYTISKEIWMMFENKSCGICQSCVDLLTYRRQSSEEIITCTMHGSIKEPIQFHIYALDPLMKQIDKSLLKEYVYPKELWLSDANNENNNDDIDMSPSQTFTTGQARKRKIDDEASSDVNVRPGRLLLKTEERKRKEKIQKRLQRFNFGTRKQSKLDALFCFSWKRWNLTTLGNLCDTDAYQDLSLSPCSIWNLSLPPVYRIIMNITASVHLITSILASEIHEPDANKEGYFTKDISLMMHYSWDINMRSAFPCIVQLLSLSFKSLSVRTLRLKILLSNYRTLESDICMLLEDMVVNAKQECIMRKGRGVYIDFDANLVYDPMSSQDTVQGILTDDVDSLSWSKVHSFIMCDQYNVVNLTTHMNHKIKEDPYMKLKIDILVPDKVISDDPVYLISLKTCESRSFIDQSILVDAASSLEVNYSDQDIDRLSSLLFSGMKCQSTTYEIAASILLDVVGITDATTCRRILFALGNELSQYVLLSDNKTRFDWKGTIIIRMIISIHIMTHQTDKAALDHYMGYNAVHYDDKRKKRLLLKRRRIRRIHQGSYLNGTNSIMGSGLIATLREMGSWLLVTYKEDRELTGYIDL